MQRQPLDLAAEGDLAVGAEADDVEDFLADIDADRGKWWCGAVHGLLLRLMRSSLGRLPRGGSSRSIPLAAIPTEARSQCMVGRAICVPDKRLIVMGQTASFEWGRRSRARSLRQPSAGFRACHAAQIGTAPLEATPVAAAISLDDLVARRLG